MGEKVIGCWEVVYFYLLNRFFLFDLVRIFKRDKIFIFYNYLYLLKFLFLKIFIKKYYLLIIFDSSDSLSKGILVFMVN